MLRQLFLNGLDALDQQLQLSLLLCPFLLRDLNDLLQLIGVGLGQVEGQLCTGRTDQLIQNAGSQNDGLQNIAGLAAKGTGTHCCQTDGNTSLRDQGKTQIVADQLVLAGNGTADKCACILANDTDKEVDHADMQQRHGADTLGTVHQCTEVEVDTRADKEQQQDGGVKVVQLLEQPLVVRQVDVDHAHGHTAQQGGHIKHGTDAAEGKQQCHRNDQAVIGGTLVQQQLEEYAEQTAQQEHGDVQNDGLDDVAGLKSAGHGSQCHRDGNAVSQQTNHIIQCHHLQQGLYKVALGMSLPDGHNGGGGCRSRGQCCQHDGEVQLQTQNKVDHDEHQNGSKAGFHDRDDQNLGTAFFQGRELEELTGAESDKCQRNVGNKAHAAHDPCRDQVEAIGADQNTGNDIGGNVGEPQTLGDAGHGKT